MDIKQQVKEYLLKENITLTDLVSILNENRPTEERTTVASLNNKLTRGTIRYNEIIEIAQALGYDITWQKPNNYGLFAQVGNSIGEVVDSVINPVRLLNPLPWGTSTKITSEVKGLFINDTEELIKESKKYEWYDTMSDKEKNELFNETQERFDSEILLDKSISNFIDEIINSILSKFDFDENTKQTLESFKGYDYFKTKIKVNKFHDSFYRFFNFYSEDKNFMELITTINNIYAIDGLSKLSDEKIDELTDSIKVYINKPKKD